MALVSNQRFIDLKSRLLDLIPELNSYIQEKSEPGRRDVVQGMVELRDLATGKLSDHGKDLLHQGKMRMSANEMTAQLMSRRDPLEVPLCSNEWHFLALVLIGISQRLNEKFGLPKDQKWIRCSWSRIKQSEPSWSIFVMIERCFRFNLRFLARYRVLSLCGMLLVWITRDSLGDFSWPLLLAVLAAGSIEFPTHVINE